MVKRVTRRPVSERRRVGEVEEDEVEEPLSRLATVGGLLLVLMSGS